MRDIPSCCPICGADIPAGIETDTHVHHEVEKITRSYHGICVKCKAYLQWKDIYTITNRKIKYTDVEDGV